MLVPSPEPSAGAWPHNCNPELPWPGELFDGERYEGSVMSFNTKAHWGFIYSQALHDNGTLDASSKGVFFHGKNVVSGRCVVPGEGVSFGLTTKEGKLQATNVAVLDPDGDEAMQAGAKYHGIVTTYSAKDRWGFVRCPDLNEYYASDMFFHENDIVTTGPVARGTQISFLLEEENVHGKPQARQVVVHQQANLGEDSALSDVAGHHQSVGGDFSRHYELDSATQRRLATARLQGCILSYSTEKAWGFVTAPGLEDALGDGKSPGIFFHVKDFVSTVAPFPLAGMTITFDYDADPHGRPRARRVLPTGEEMPPEHLSDRESRTTALVPISPRPDGNLLAPPRPAAIRQVQVADRLEGFVLTYSEEKGWGFLSAPGLESVLGDGKGIFFHITDYVGRSSIPKAGDPVSFAYSKDPMGKPRAQDVRPSGADTSELLDESLAAEIAVLAPPPLDIRYEGKVQSYYEGKAWGFIAAPTLEQWTGPGKGIFFHIKDCSGAFGDARTPSVGCPVSFHVHREESGKLHAKSVIAAACLAFEPAEKRTRLI